MYSNHVAGKTEVEGTRAGVVVVSLANLSEG